jgi:hypothetical protein
LFGRHGVARGLLGRARKEVRGTVGVLALDAAADGDRINLLLALRPPGAAGVKLQHVRSRDGGESWGSPTTILPGRAKIATPHRGADPQIIARGDTLVALWTEPGTSAWGSGPLATARSDDGGRTWSAGRRHWINATSPATGTG